MEKEIADRQLKHGITEVLEPLIGYFHTRPQL